MRGKKTVSLFFRNHRKWHTRTNDFLIVVYGTLLLTEILRPFFLAFLVLENIGCSLKRGLFSQGKRERVHPVQQSFYEHPSCTIASKFLTTDSPSCSPSNGWDNASYKIGVMSPTKSLFHLPASFLTNSLFTFIWKVLCFYQTKL